MVLSLPFSFMIEVIRFYKVIMRILALAFPIWYSQKMNVKRVIQIVLITFILSLILDIFIVIENIWIPSSFILASCYFSVSSLGYQFLAILISPLCLPHYVLNDELFPMGLIIIVLDIVLLILLRYRLKKFSSDRKRNERLLMYIILLDMIYNILDLIRRIFFVLHDYVHTNTGYNNPLRYNIRMRLFINIVFPILILKREWNSIMYTIDMIYVYLLMRKILRVVDGQKTQTKFVTPVTNLTINTGSIQKSK